MGSTDGMNNGSVTQGPGTQYIMPNYSAYTGTLSYIANTKLRSHVPNFLAESDLKLELLKRQHISLAQVKIKCTGVVVKSYSATMALSL